MFKCPSCGTEMEKIWFTEKEYSKSGWFTGRTRRAVSHLECPECFTREAVDDSFDGPWEPYSSIK